METKNPWYHSNVGIVVLLILFFPVGLYLMWKYANWNKRIKLGISGFFLILLIVGALSPDSKKAESPSSSATSQPNQASVSAAEPKSTQPSTPTVVEPDKLLYEIIEKKEESNLVNYKILISSGVDGKAVATEVKKSCSKPCNISVYDDRRALDLEIEYDKMLGNYNNPPSVMLDWKKKNYVYVADHFVGLMSFDSDEWQEYLYKDWYYKELKGE